MGPSGVRNSWESTCACTAVQVGVLQLYTAHSDQACCTKAHPTKPTSNRTAPPSCNLPPVASPAMALCKAPNMAT